MRAVRPWFSPLVILLVAILSLVVPIPSWAATIRGTTNHVADGDTVTLDTSAGRERVRLLGIDAPEKAQVPWGPRSKAYLERLVLGKTVRVETDVESHDRYGRLLGYLFVDRTFVNLEMVAQGLAMLYTHPPNVAHTAELVAAQRAARAAGRGIWAPAGGLDVSPYEFRHPGKHAPAAIGQTGLPVRGETPVHVDAAVREARSEPTTATASGNSSGVAPVIKAGPIVGNLRSHKYHSLTCPLAGKISVENRTSFASIEAGKKAGFTPCGRCHGGKPD